MPSQRPTVLRPSWETIPSIFSTVKSYTSIIEWFYYLTYISHIICKSESAHIAKANLISLLRARPAIQIWHEALLSEMYDEDEPNLPSMLDGTNFLRPSVQRFYEHTTQRFGLMTRADVFVARCVVVDFIYRNLDDAQRAAEAAQEARRRNLLQEQGRLVQQQQKARENSLAVHLRFGSPRKDAPPVGQIGVNDLAALLDAISLHISPELPVQAEPVLFTLLVPKEKPSWVNGLARSLSQLMSRPTRLSRHESYIVIAVNYNSYHLASEIYARESNSYINQVLDLMNRFALTEGARPADANAAKRKVMRCLEIVIESQQQMTRAVGDLAAEMASMAV